MGIKQTLGILDLYRGDYHRSLHLSEIARLIDEERSTAYKQIKPLEQKGLIRSTKIGRNVNHFLDLSNITTKHYLVLAEICVAIKVLEKPFPNPIKKAADKLTVQVDGILILFGSFARDQARETSDIDLFVIGSEVDEKLVQSVEALIGREINIKHSTKAEFLRGLSAKSPLEHEVLSNHIILKGADAFCDTLWEYYAK